MCKVCFCLFACLEQKSHWVSFIKNKALPYRCNDITMEWWVGMQRGLRKDQKSELWGKAESGAYTVSNSACICTSVAFFFFFLMTHLCSSFHMVGERCPHTAPRDTCWSSGQVGWLNTFHSLALCSNSKFLGNIDLTDFSSHSRSSWLWNSLAWLLWVHCSESDEN